VAGRLVEAAQWERCEGAAADSLRSVRAATTRLLGVSASTVHTAYSLQTTYTLHCTALEAQAGALRWRDLVPAGGNIQRLYVFANSPLFVQTFPPKLCPICRVCPSA